MISILCLGSRTFIFLDLDLWEIYALFLSAKLFWNSMSFTRFSRSSTVEFFAFSTTGGFVGIWRIIGASCYFVITGSILGLFKWLRSIGDDLVWGDLLKFGVILFSTGEGSLKIYTKSSIIVSGLSRAGLFYFLTYFGLCFFDYFGLTFLGYFGLIKSLGDEFSNFF